MPEKLYERDFNLWAQEQAKALRSRQFTKLDYDNLIEEIEDMGKSEKKAVASNLRIVLLHLLKYKYQSAKKTDSWTNSIVEHRIRLLSDFEDSPSLKRHCESVFDKQYQYARKQASIETKLSIDTFPARCPFTFLQTLDLDYLPE